MDKETAIHCARIKALEMEMERLTARIDALEAALRDIRADLVIEVVDPWIDEGDDEDRG